MNAPTVIDELKNQLSNAKLEIKHLNAVNQELQDMLTEAKIKIRNWKVNNVYLKGPGDFEPECTPEPSDTDIVKAIREHPIKVAENAVKTLSMELQSALVTLAKYDDSNDLLVVLSDSAKDLLYRECI